MKVFIIVTDGQMVLMDVAGASATLPNHTHWPVTKAAGRKSRWPLAILRHITYDLLPQHCDTEEDEESGPRKLKNAFGVDKDTSVYILTLPSTVLENVVIACAAVRRWHFHHANYTCPWKLKLLPIASAIKEDVSSALCLRAFQESSFFESPKERESG